MRIGCGAGSSVAEDVGDIEGRTGDVGHMTPLDHDYADHNSQRTTVPSSSDPAQLCNNLDLVVRWDEGMLYHARQLHIRGKEPQPDEGPYREYLSLYNLIVPPVTFDNLPTPNNFKEKKKRVYKKKSGPHPPILGCSKFQNHIDLNAVLMEREEKEAADKMAKKESEKAAKALAAKAQLLNKTQRGLARKTLKNTVATTPVNRHQHM